MLARDMASADRSTYARIKKICLSLPGTKETITWGKPHFRVGEKIFCGYGEEDGRMVIGFKLERPHADLLTSGKDGRFRRAPYVGHHGWVSMDASRIEDWKQVEGFVRESYRLIAPKKNVALMDEGAGPAPRRRKR
jgi:predicted DNA-binding protein (MmcQ/YjbR family)